MGKDISATPTPGEDDSAFVTRLLSAIEPPVLNADDMARLTACLNRPENRGNAESQSSVLEIAKEIEHRDILRGVRYFNNELAKMRNKGRNIDQSIRTLSIMCMTSFPAMIRHYQKNAEAAKEVEKDAKEAAHGIGNSNEPTGNPAEDVGCAVTLSPAVRRFCAFDDFSNAITNFTLWGLPVFEKLSSAEKESFRALLAKGRGALHYYLFDCQKAVYREGLEDKVPDEWMQFDLSHFDVKTGFPDAKRHKVKETLDKMHLVSMKLMAEVEAEAAKGAGETGGSAEHKPAKKSDKTAEEKPQAPRPITPEANEEHWWEQWCKLTAEVQFFGPPEKQDELRLREKEIELERLQAAAVVFSAHGLPLFINLARGLLDLLTEYPRYCSENLKAIAAHDPHVIAELRRKGDILRDGFQAVYREAWRLGLRTDPAPLIKALLPGKIGEGDRESIEAAGHTLHCLLLDAQAIHGAGKAGEETPAERYDKMMAEGMQRLKDAKVLPDPKKGVFADPEPWTEKMADAQRYYPDDAVLRGFQEIFPKCEPDEIWDKINTALMKNGRTPPEIIQWTVSQAYEYLKAIAPIQANGAEKTNKIDNTNSEPTNVNVLNEVRIAGFDDFTRSVQDAIQRSSEERRIAEKEKIDAKVSAFLKDNPGALMKEVCAYLDKACPRAGKEKWERGAYLSNLPAWRAEMDRRAGLFKSKEQKEDLHTDVTADSATASGNRPVADKDSVLKTLEDEEVLGKLLPYLYENPRASFIEACKYVGVTPEKEMPQDKWEELKACLIDQFKDKKKEEMARSRVNRNNKKEPGM